MYFLYNNFDISDKTVTDGTATLSLPNWTFSSSDSVTNEYGINDYSIDHELTNFDANDWLRIDMGESKTITDWAIYTSSSNTADILLRVGSDPATIAHTPNSQIQNPNGWASDTLSDSGRYFFLENTSAAMTGLAEIVLGKKLTFDTRPDTSIAENRNARTNINEAYSGKQYAQRLADTKKSWTLTWSNMSSSFKDDLITMRDIVSLDVPFLFNDDSNTYFVRMASGLDMTEVAHQRFSTSINLIEQ